MNNKLQLHFIFISFSLFNYITLSSSNPVSLAPNEAPVPHQMDMPIPRTETVCPSHCCSSHCCHCKTLDGGPCCTAKDCRDCKEYCKQGCKQCCFISFCGCFCYDETKKKCHCCGVQCCCCK